MEVYFKSLDSDNNEITFRTEAHYEDDYLVFEDSVVEDTTIFLKATNENLALIRKGKINMTLNLFKDKKGILRYEEGNLYFELDAIYKNIAVNEKQIIFEYDLSDGQNVMGNHKIWVNLIQ